MALTLAEAAKLSNDVLLTGVIETILKDSPVLQRLPFIEIVAKVPSVRDAYPAWVSDPKTDVHGRLARSPA